MRDETTMSTQQAPQPPHPAAHAAPSAASHPVPSAVTLPAESEPSWAHIVLVDPRWPTQLPVEWITQLRGTCVAADAASEPAVAVLQSCIAPGPQSVLVATDFSAALWRQWHPQAEIWEVPSRQDPVAQAQYMIQRAWDLGSWERQQTHQSLLPYLQEEAQEFCQAITAAEGDAQVCAELGDLLLQVLFHAEIARRRGAFGFPEVAASFVAKMARRAPYLVDGTTQPVSIAEQEALWQAAKQREQEHSATATTE